MIVKDGHFKSNLYGVIAVYRLYINKAHNFSNVYTRCWDWVITILSRQR